MSKTRKLSELELQQFVGGSDSNKCLMGLVGGWAIGGLNGAGSWPSRSYDWWSLRDTQRHSNWLCYKLLTNLKTLRIRFYFKIENYMQTSSE